MAAAAAAATPAASAKHLRVLAFSNTFHDLTSKRASSHSGAFHCEEALRCFIMRRLTTKLSRAAIPRIWDLKGGRRRRRNGVCRAEFAQDAPFAAAIGACVLSSLVFMSSGKADDEDDDNGGAMDSTDTRLAVMGIISFIPYFNWLSWIFAWLDSGSQRYLVYSIVYLAPYFRTNLSLSPEESWLPIASIFACILHIQLETSIKNGDVGRTQLFEEARKIFPGGRRRKNSQLQEPRENVRDWRISRKPLDDVHRHPDESLVDLEDEKESE